VSAEREGYVYWWFVAGPGGPFVKTTWSSRRQSARHITEYDRENGWKVGRVHFAKVRIELETP
jgi:hypothetical protein